MVRCGTAGSRGKHACRRRAGCQHQTTAMSCRDGGSAACACAPAPAAQPAAAAGAGTGGGRCSLKPGGTSNRLSSTWVAQQGGGAPTGAKQQRPSACSVDARLGGHMLHVLGQRLHVHRAVVNLDLRAGGGGGEGGGGFGAAVCGAAPRREESARTPPPATQSRWSSAAAPCSCGSCRKGQRAWTAGALHVHMRSPGPNPGTMRRIDGQYQPAVQATVPPCAPCSCCPGSSQTSPACASSTPCRCAAVRRRQNAGVSWISAAWRRCSMR